MAILDEQDSTRPPGFVKVCGITTEDDALLCAAMGADAVGFVFAPSTSQVTPNRARDVAKRVPNEVLTVGVFRNEAPERVVEIVNGAGLRAAQLHGHESIEDSLWIAERVPIVIKSFGAGDPNIDRASQYGAAAVLVDNITPGSGEVFDWRLLDSSPGAAKLILAGGLNADNVGDGITQVRPWGVDAKSGVESEPGRKDPTKVRLFIRAARAAFINLAEAREHTEPTESAEQIYNWIEE